MVQMPTLRLIVLVAMPWLSYAALHFADFPPAGAIPPTNSSSMKQWLGELDLSGAPNIPRNSGEPPDCPSSDDPDVCYWTCDECAADDVVACPNENDWGLTFDDGPTTATPSLLDFLTQQKVQATFFLVGSNVVQYPEIVAREVKDGHHLASHTWSHQALTTLTNEQIVAELRWTEKAIYDITGLRVKYVRPPYGDVDNRVRFVLRQMGYIVVDWTGDTYDSNDWKIPSVSPEDIVETFGSAIGNYSYDYSTMSSTKGFISLQHDLTEETISVAKQVIPMGIEANLNIKTVASCLGDTSGYASTINATSATKPPSDRPTEDGSTDHRVHPTNSAASFLRTRRCPMSILAWPLSASSPKAQQSIHNTWCHTSPVLTAEKLVWSSLVFVAFAIGLAAS